ncbi:DUF58 domain-containing protein [Ferrimonas senticii]|uniref:DUF58 domain-containing protein n=1 Tax=Ferrimonas senticii TaxID=394566 RepID=UPI000404D0D2|nr:DUF58 domain-containing protein [Ferrimonas senticii]
MTQPESLTLPRHGDGVHLCLQELIARAEHQVLVRSHHSGNARALLAGERLSRLKGRGMEFAEVRPYQYGDDVRTIDWRVTARSGKAHTKLFRDEREQPLLLCVDLGARMQLGSQLLLQSVQAAHLAATLGWHVCQQGDRLGGIIASELEHRELKPKARRAGLLPLLEAMVELQQPEQLSELSQQGDDDYWLAALERLRRLARSGSQVVIIANPLGFADAAMEQIRQLQKHAQVRLFCISDPLFQRLASHQGSLPIWTGSHSLWLDRGSGAQLANRWQHAQQRAQQLGQQQQLPLTEISAARPLQQQWQQLWL